MNPENLVPMDLDDCVLGKRYRVTDLISTVMTQISRYAKKRSTSFPHEWMSIYYKMQEAFKNRYLDEKKIRRVTAEDISRHLHPVVEKMARTGKIFNIDGLFMNSNLDETFKIRFFLKDITKAVLAKSSNADKCGQGISAWSAEMNAVYCALFRAIEEKFVYALKDNSLDANKMSEADLDYEIKNRYDPSFPSMVNDYSQFDESQNAATQLLEDAFLDLFVPSFMTEIYREMRLKAKMVSPIATLVNEALKNSGESATEFMNQIVSRFITMMIVKPSDVIVEGYKGDDTFINAKKIKLSNWLLTLNPSLTIPMKSDIDYPKHVDFCGFYLSPYGIIPDLLRYDNKFLTKEFFKQRSDGLDYCNELRNSMQDRWKFLTYEKIRYLYEVYRDIYHLTDHEIDMIIMTYKYFSVNKAEEHHQYGASALYDGDNNYQFNDHGAQAQNAKRVYSSMKGASEQVSGWW